MALISAMVRGGGTKPSPWNSAVIFFASSSDTARGWQAARPRAKPRKRMVNELRRRSMPRSMAARDEERLNHGSDWARILRLRPYGLRSGRGEISTAINRSINLSPCPERSRRTRRRLDSTSFTPSLERIGQHPRAARRGIDRRAAGLQDDADAAGGADGERPFRPRRFPPRPDIGENIEAGPRIAIFQPDPP